MREDSLEFRGEARQKEACHNPSTTTQTQPTCLPRGVQDVLWADHLAFFVHRSLERIDVMFGNTLS